MTNEEKIEFLIETIKTISNAIDSGAPSMALWELRRAMPVIESWEQEQ